MRRLRVGLIGTGFMGRTHSNAFRQAPVYFPTDTEVELTAVCGRDPQRTETFARTWGYRSFETDWRKLIERDDIDLVDIATPNNLHAEIAIAAAGTGKLVSCEKPLGTSLHQSRQMAEAVAGAGVASMVWYNYRRIPAVTMAKRMIDAGALGRVFHYRSKFLQDWTISADLPQGGNATWRLDAAAAGSGVTGDLLAHCIDTAMWLNGPISAVCGMTETFIKERRHLDSNTAQPVTIDDASAFLARFDNGSLATFEATRYARGHKAQFTFEINGESGSLAWDLHDLHRLSYFDNADAGETRGWRSIHVTDGDHPYMDAWWVPGLQIGYEHSFVHQFADFVRGLASGDRLVPDFADALRTDAVTDAVLTSAAHRNWQPVGRRE